MSGLVLSLFPGIGLLDLAFEEEGFCVVRGPDLLWGGDIHRFHPPAGKFDGVIGGPPCQAFSRLRYLVQANGYRTAPNLIPEFERTVREAASTWFLMENVPDAPLPDVPGYAVQDQLVNNRWCGGEQNRVRRFSFGSRIDAGSPVSVTGVVTRRLPRFEVPGEALEPSAWEPAVCASGGCPTPARVGGSGKTKATFTERHKATRKGASAMGYKTEAYLVKALRDQGCPPDFLDGAPFTVAGKIRVIGNGVPLPMGRAVARAVKEALCVR